MTPPEAEPPNTLAAGRYTLADRLGAGGMASVYRAWDNRLAQWRAAKVLHPAFARRAAVRARFEGEARLMAAIEHRNIVRVYDVGEEAETPYIVMELLEGGSPADWLDRNGPMPARLAAEVVLQLCAGLAYAHERGVIHRDVKPSNLLVAADGTCKVSDFGIARIAVDPEGEAANLTRTGSMMGTLGFMAPEQRSDAKNVDVRADVYAIGATLYNLLTAKTSLELFLAAQRPTLLVGVPPRLAPIIARACVFDREGRFPTVRALEAELARLAAGLPPISADVPALVRPLAPAPAATRTYAPTAAPERGPAPPTTDAPPPETPGSRSWKNLPGRPSAAAPEAPPAPAPASPHQGPTVASERTIPLGPAAPAVVSRTVVAAQARTIPVLVQHECTPKRLIGGGRPLDGAIAIWPMLTARSWRRRVDQEAQRHRLRPDEVDLSAPGERAPLTRSQLSERCEPLDRHGGACAGCPARVVDDSFGCFLHLDLPITVEAEDWLLGRVLTTDAVGGRLGLDWLDAHRHQGKRIARYRTEGWFESKVAPKVQVKQGWLLGRSVSADQALEAILLPDANSLDPIGAFSLACWLGVFAYDGVGPGALEDYQLRQMLELAPKERVARTTCVLGDRPAGGAGQMHDLARALYLAWCSDARLLIEL